MPSWATVAARNKAGNTTAAAGNKPGNKATAPAPARSAWATPARNGAQRLPSPPPAPSNDWDATANYAGTAWVTPDSSSPAAWPASTPTAPSSRPIAAAARTAAPASTTGPTTKGPIYFSASDKAFAEFSPAHERKGGFQCALGFEAEDVKRGEPAFLASVQQGLWMFEATFAIQSGWGQSIHSLRGQGRQAAKVAAMEEDDEDLRGTYVDALRARPVLEALVKGAFAYSAGWSGVEKLLATGDREIVFLAGTDTAGMYFGCGTDNAKQHRQLSAAKRGDNALGKALMAAREWLRTPALAAWRERQLTMTSAEREFSCPPKVEVAQVALDLGKLTL